jgi:SAM-dependent methyltransferase
VRSGETIKLRNPASSGEPKRRSLTGLRVKDGLVRHPFDLEFGVRTSGLVAGRHLGTGHRHDRHATAYYAVAPSVLRGILVRWRRCKPLAPLDEFTFIDLGAGMGRALLLASEFPFRSVLGVELNPTLTRIARRNLAVWRAAGRARAPMQIIDGDAAAFELPLAPCVAFLFNPFGGPVLRRILGNWSDTFAGRSVKLDILYVNNEQENVLRRQDNLTRLFHGQIRRSHADNVADRRILLSQPDGEYAAMAWEDCSIYRWTGDDANRAAKPGATPQKKAAGERA